MPRPKVLLVGWDSADWNIAHPLIDRGETPALRRIVEQGVCGNLRTLDPMLSPMLWMSIATGKRAYDHGVLGFTEIDPMTGRVRPVTAASRRCRAVWDILAEQGLRCHVLGWFASHGGQIPGGGVVSNAYTAPTAGPGQTWPPAPRGTIWPDAHSQALNDLRVSPEDIDGDTVGLFVPRWQEIDVQRDRRLNQLQVHLAEAFSIHAAACWTLQNTDWDFMAVYYRAIDELAHDFMPFHPPRMEGTPQHDFDLYSEVMNSAYRLHDHMLARLLALAPPDTHVVLVSDHGFHCDHLRPRFVPQVPSGITVWHREHGMLAGAGPQFARDHLLRGASLLDVTPTLLHLYGLPVGEDMEGKVLLDAFAQPQPVRTKPTWEDGTLPFAAGELSEAESRALLEQFEALGYIDKPSDNPSADAALHDRENRWALARALLDGGRVAQALPLLEDLCAEVPDRSDFPQTLARCQMQVGLHDEAAATLDTMLGMVGHTAQATLVRAQLAADRQDHAAAVQWLEQARASHASEPRFWRQLGFALVQLHRWPQAQEAFETLADLAPGDAHAQLGFATCHLHQQRPQQAAQAALVAISLDFAMARAHFVLARALLRQGELQRAEQALRATVKLAPGFAHGWQLLARLCHITGRQEESQRLQGIRLSVLAQRRQQPLQVQPLREELRERAAQRQARAAAAAAAAAAPAASHTGHDTALDITVVSGAPRSGTSLMMQMLAAGGHPIFSDGVRAADDNNPRGYHEHQGIRDLARNPAVLAGAGGRAVKVVSAHVPSLPRRHRYKVIFMRRPLEEIARSQHRMRFGGQGNPQELASTVVPMLDKHIAQTLRTLRTAPQIELLEIDYTELVRDPLPVVDRLVEFLGQAALPQADAMANVVDASLHRQRI